MVYEVYNVGKNSPGEYVTQFNNWQGGQMVGSGLYYYGKPKGDTMTFNPDIAREYDIPYYLDVFTPAKLSAPVPAPSIKQEGETIISDMGMPKESLYIIAAALLLLLLMRR